MFEAGKELVFRNRPRAKSEDFGQVVGEARLHFLGGNIAAEESFKGGSFAVGDAARNDEIEIAQVGRDVVGKAVGSHPAADVDADGGKFFLGKP